MRKNSALLFLILLLAGCKFNKVNFQGFVEAEPVYLNSQNSGKLIELKVASGQYLNKNELAFKLEDISLQKNWQASSAVAKQAKATLDNAETPQRKTVLESFEAEIRSAKAMYELAKKKLTRAVKLQQKGAIDQDSLDSAIADEQKTKAQLMAATANLAEARLGQREYIINADYYAVNAAKDKALALEASLKQLTVYAAISGYVLETYYNVGEWVKPYAPVVSMVDPSMYYIKFYLPQNLLPKLKVGDKLVATDNINKFTTTVTSIAVEASYTPPMVFADANNTRFVYLVKTKLLQEDTKLVNLGQPVKIIWDK